MSQGECLSPDAIKALAWAACESEGLTLSELIPAMDCAPGASTNAKVTCCGPGAAPSESTPECSPLTVGDGLTCVDTAILEEQAESVCAASGMSLAKVEPGVACAPGAAAQLHGWCCPAADPNLEPPPDGTLGDMVTCVANEKLALAASATCDSLGLVLLDLWTADDCDGDASTTAKYLCGE